MAQIKNYQQLELLSTNFIRRDETDPLTVASLSVVGSTSGISHGDLDDLDADDHDGATNGYILREPNAGVADNSLVRWDGTDGRNVQLGAASLSDAGDLSIANNLTVDSDGGVQTYIRGNSIELGQTGGTGSASYIDFWAEGDGGDYDCRIYVSGGVGAGGEGYGNMDIVARGGLDLLVYPDDVYIDNDLYVDSDAEVDGDLTVTTSGDRYHGTYVGYIYHPITDVKILETSTSTDTTRNQIDVSAYGIPTSAKALNVRIAIRDSGSAATDCYIIFFDASSGGGSTGTFSPMPVNDRYGRYTGVLNSGSNGDIWWTASASGTNTLDIIIYCTGYFI